MLLCGTGMTGKWNLGVEACSLHVIHGAFITGSESTNWEMKKKIKKIKGSFQLLHGSPARRADYLSVTELDIFPFYFCATRWVEDKKVADRLLELWENLTKDYDRLAVLTKPKRPSCRSYEHA